jgi:hypothetical protein
MIRMQVMTNEVAPDKLAHHCADGDHQRCPGLGADLAYVITSVCGCACHDGHSLEQRVADFDRWAAECMALERRLLEGVGFDPDALRRCG